MPSSTAAGGTRFAAVDAMLRIEFDDELLLFNPLSWETHVLNPAAAVVLDLLVQAPRSAREVAAFLAELLCEADRERADEHAATLLRDLAALSLIRAEGETEHATS